MSGVLWGWGVGPSGFGWRSTAEAVTQGIDATGLTAVVTGGYSGIGKETVRVLALRGAHVVIAGRNTDAGRTAKNEVLKEVPNAKVDVMELDLNSFDSIRHFAEEYLSKGLALNILINNAGVMMLPYQVSGDGVETHFATNHLGHFLLTNLLLDNLKETAKATGIEGRIVNVSSIAHLLTYKGGIRLDRINDKNGYNRYQAYGQSKLANILHANELTRQLKEEGAQVTANSLHPGIISTRLTRYSRLTQIGMAAVGMFAKTISQGAASTCYVALHPNVKGVSGEYFDNSNATIKKTAYSNDAELAKNLWKLSAEIVSSS